jgi:hypothetical protein
MSHTQPVTEAKSTTSRLATIKALLNKAEGASTDAERDAYTSKAAELISKYSIDEAMLADKTGTTTEVVDRVIWTDRPFASRFADLLWFIADPMGAQCRSVKQHTGSEQVGQLKWRYGLRVFAHEADLARIEMLYASVRNQALAGASKIKGHDKFGQDQKAHRESYIEGFSHAVAGRVRRAEDEARTAAEAEREALQEKALLSGELTTSRSVELVLADRRAVVKNAMNVAIYGKTTAELDAQNKASRERWAELDEQARQRRERKIEEQAACVRCQEAKSGYCNTHRHMKPSQAMGRSYERVGNYYHDGYEDGYRASLGSTRTQVGNDTRTAIG